MEILESLNHEKNAPLLVNLTSRGAKKLFLLLEVQVSRPNVLIYGLNHYHPVTGNICAIHTASTYAKLIINFCISMMQRTRIGSTLTSLIECDSSRTTTLKLRSASSLLIFSMKLYPTIRNWKTRPAKDWFLLD